MLVAMLMTAAAATPEAIGVALSQFNEVASMPLAPWSAAQVADLARGEVVTRLERREDGHHRAVGVALCSVPKEAMWLATQDPHFTGGDEAIEAEVSKEAHRGTWYGMLEVPAPFSDRHWVIDVWDNVSLARASNDRVWEHPWRLRAGAVGQLRERVSRGEVRGLTLAMFDDAIETPVNEGALVFLELSERESLFAYHVTTDVGGAVPERLVAGFVRRAMTDHIRHLQKRAVEELPSHYRGTHTAVPNLGDGVVELYP